MMIPSITGEQLTMLALSDRQCQLPRTVIAERIKVC